MNKKKGFTLVEILAVVIILGVLIFLITPVLINTVKTARETAYNVQMENIEKAAKDFITEKGTSIESLAVVDGTHLITLDSLQTQGYIDLNIKNPKTNAELNPLTTTILITKLANGTYSYAITVN